ncbi:MAG: GH3 auxin-responsive promoter family protein, partial [Chitinophagaceae bacterium]
MTKIKSFLAKPFANYVYKQIKKGMSAAVADQEATLQYLIKIGIKTDFGKQHSFEKIKTYEDFVRYVPIRDYEDFKTFIEAIKQGKHNVLWKGLPIYFAKTSGTTSGIKYIPITKESIPNHINTARNALLCYM